MTSREALNEICDNCECHLILSHKTCPYKRPYNDRCDEYKEIITTIEVEETLKKMIKSKLSLTKGVELTISGTEEQVEQILEWIGDEI